MSKHSRLLGQKIRALGLLLCLVALWSGIHLFNAPRSTLLAQQAQPTSLPEEEPETSNSAETSDSTNSTPEPTFSGLWYTHLATLDLQQDGSQVTGTIAGYDGNWNFQIAGDVTGDVLTVAASEVTETFTLALSDDGKEVWGDAEDALQWCGVRKGSLPDGCGYSGTWSIYSEDYTVPSGSYFQLVQTQGVVTGNLYSLEQTPLQSINATVEWGKGYNLQVADNEALGTLTWFQDGKAFGVTPNEQSYELQLNRANSIGPFIPSAYNPVPASIVDREDVPLILPAPLYFLSAEGQIMYLDPVQFKATQLTNEVTPITSFDVASTHSGLVYVFEQQLVEMDIISKTRTVLIDGRLVDENVNTEGSSTNEAEARDKQLSNPRYSPDGQQIVYVHEGLSVIDSPVGARDAEGSEGSEGAEGAEDSLSPSPTKLVENIRFDSEAINAGEVRRYFDALWSPRGRYLLTRATLWEGIRSDIIDASTGESLFAEDFWMPCCDPAWGISDDSVVVASTALAYGQPGLYHVDVPSESINAIFDGMANQSNLLMMAHATHQAQSGEIYALLSQMDMNLPGSFTAESSFVLHQVSKSGEVTPLNAGGIAPRELLWAEDDSGLLIIDEYGTLQWLPADGDSATSLFIAGSNLRWGTLNPEIDEAFPTYLTEEFPLQSYPHRGLAKQAAEDLELGFSPEQASETVGIQYLASPAEQLANNAGLAGSVWAAYSTQFRDFEQDLGHWIALYTQKDGAWEQIDVLQFPLVAEGELEEGPDYVGMKSLQPTNLSADRYWLSFEGGVGAHSSRYFLLSFDGADLAIEASGFSTAGGAGWLDDANFDGVPDYLILDSSDYYIFCYACGVRRIQYSLLRWDGTAMVPVELTLLDDEAAASISPEWRELNNRAVAQAQAGLWNEVERAMSDFYELSQDGPTDQRIEDNFAIIRVHLSDIQQTIYSQEQPYPLLTTIFYGDYAAAYGLVQNVSAEEIFSLNSPLIVGTAAEGWEDSLAQNILVSTESALAYAPDRAEIHFFSGWANWLMGDTEEAVAALTVAAEIVPNDTSYQEALTVLKGYAESEVNAHVTPGGVSHIISHIVTLAVMNLRSGPGTNFAVIGSMAQDAQAPVLDKSADGEWWKIYVEELGAEAWISASPEYTGVAYTSGEQGSTADTDTANTSDPAEFTPALVAQLDASSAVMAFSPDDSTLVTAGSDGLHVWDTATWTERWQEELPPGVRIESLDLSPDGTRILVGSNDGRARLLMADSGAPIATFTFGESVRAVDFNADGTYAAAGAFDGKMIVADAATGTLLAELQNDLPLHDLALSPDGPWIAAMTAGSKASVDLVVWDFLTTENRSLASYSGVPGHSNIAFSSDTAWVAGSLSSGGPIRIWQTQTWPEIATVESGVGQISKLLFSPNNRRLAALVSGSEAYQLVVWGATSWAELTRIQLPDVAWDMAFSSDSNYIAVGLGQNSVNEAQIWEADSGKLIAQLPHPRQVTRVVFSTSGQWVAVGGGNSAVHVWGIGRLRE